MKIRMRFEKKDLIKFISHLDMLRAFDRAMRRAGLPVAFSQGYNPRPKVSYTPALPVGTTSSGEYMDLELYKDMEPSEVKYRLNQALPRGLGIIKADYVYEQPPLSQLNCAIYIVNIHIRDVSSIDIKTELSTFLKKEQIVIDKKTKRGIRSVNIAPLIHNIEFIEKDDEYAKLIMDLATGQQGNLAPRQFFLEFENTLSKRITVKKVHRQDFYLSKDNQKISPL